MSPEMSSVEETLQDIRPSLIHLAHTYFIKLPNTSTHIDFQDMLQDAIVICLEVMDEYDANYDASFSTFVFGCVQHNFINLVQMEYRRLNIQIPQTLLMSEETGLEEIECAQLLATVSMQLSANAREVLHCLIEPSPELVIQALLRKNTKESFQIWHVDIAEYLDLSPSTVSACMTEITDVMQRIYNE